ncbi:MAG: retroviral-like aspartic protease family protein [Firmicutes bacterium]|nr:retroviral-like aspartic protease family protein [Bacillota bacterium]MCM1401191.1 retroviral-like aspartic protease family protein [Bacteroides sp.]MCM1477112.1 retroviral-like aspartic protease family protein [Bacteroides sp.]
MKKFITIFGITVGVALLVLVLGCIAVSRGTQHGFSVEQLSDETPLMPLSGIPYCLEVMPGLKLKFDTGADISTLTDADAEKLRQAGYEVKEKFGPIGGRDGYGRTEITARRYTVTLPVGGYVINADSTGKSSLVYSGSPAALLHNVDFQKVESGISTLGLDFLRKFKIECIYNLQAAMLGSTMPQGYQKVIDITRNLHFWDYLWSPIRSYITVNVNQNPNIYLIDTGLQRAAVKKPYSQRNRAKGNLHHDSVKSLVNKYDAWVDEEAWIDFGVRSGTKPVHYYDNPEDDYQINPLNVFQQDILLDLENAGIYFRPTSY